MGPGAARASCAPENLKAAAEDSDTGGMFKAVSLLPGLPGAVLEQLRLSLNTPVVALESLPVGPAAAAIALHRGPRAARLSLAVRATRGGQLLFFHPEGWAESELSEVVLDAALSFAEGMGFLFDQDLVSNGGSAGRAQALQTWLDLMGSREPPAGAELVSEQSELLLDELVGPDSSPDVMDDLSLSHSLSDEAGLLSETAPLEPGLDEPRGLDPALVEVPEEGAQTEPQGEAPDAPPPASMLSKFRRPASPGSKGGSMVGRIPLVRVRAENDAGDRSGWLARLLSAF